MRLTITYSKIKRNLVLINNDTYQRETLSERPIRQPLNAKYHVITNATYSCHNRNPVPVKFKNVINIETCTLLCCDHTTL